MGLIMHIDTALNSGSVGLSRDGKMILSFENQIANDHAAFVQPAIEKLVKQTGIQLDQLDAIGVVAGPGSYTGLRVGMASAKGLCYALDKPLLAVNTLQLMAEAAMTEFQGHDLYCPMIDARRDEVFTAVYDATGKEVLPPQPMILNGESFLQLGPDNAILFVGNAISKAKIILNNNFKWKFLEYHYPITLVGNVFFKAFSNREFRNLAYTEPFYLKDFYFGPPVVK